MAKCIRCGANGMGVLHYAIKLKDGNQICFKCYKELGRDPWKDARTVGRMYTYEEIKDGFDAMYERQRKEEIVQAVMDSVSIRIVGGSQDRDLDATADELKVYDIIRSILDRSGLDTDPVQLIRKSDSYLSVVMESAGDYGLMDLARIKYTDRAKWIRICPQFDKIPLMSTDDVGKCTDLLLAGYRFNEPYL